MFSFLFSLAKIKAGRHWRLTGNNLRLQSQAKRVIGILLTRFYKWLMTTNRGVSQKKGRYGKIELNHE